MHECSMCGSRSLICTYGNNQGLWRIHCPNGHVMVAAPGYEISIYVDILKENEQTHEREGEPPR
jgi:hypothetical protein